MIFQNQEDYDAVDVSGIDPGLKVYFFVDLSSISEGEGYLFYLLTFSWNVSEGFPEQSFEFFFYFLMWYIQMPLPSVNIERCYKLAFYELRD